MEGADAKSAADAILKELQRLTLEKDFAGMAELYSPDAAMYMEGKDEPIMGKQGIMESFSLYQAYGVEFWNIDEVDFIAGPNSATQIANFICKDAKGNEVMRGKYTAVYKKIGNLWYIAQDFSNSDKHDIKGELRERFAKWNHMYASKDIAGLVNELYTDDVKILIPGYPMIQGKTDLLKLFKEYPTSQIQRTDQVLGDIEKITDDVVVECGGQFTARDKTGVPAERGRYMVVWKRVNGKFCVHSEIVNPKTSDK